MKKINLKCCLIVLLLQYYLFPASGITAKFSYSKLNYCSPAIVVFSNESTQGTGITYTWDFGVGAVVTATDYLPKEQFYSKPGQYTVRLKVSDGINTDSTSASITIYKGPAANFTPDRITGCPPMQVRFTSSSTPGDAEIISSVWDFRNGEFRDGPAVQYSYNTSGLYDVILKVTDKNGCASLYEADKIISVTDKPEVNFAASDTFACSPPLNVTFTNLSKGSSQLIYKWDYGNGGSSTDLSNSSVYNSTGSFDVRIKATDQNGCSDSLIKKSYITIGYPKGNLTVFDTRNNKVTTAYICDGTYKFVCSVADLPDYNWIITEDDKTSTIKGGNSITYLVKGSGKIDVKLIYGKSQLCTDSISVSFFKSYIKADFSMDNSILCSTPSLINLRNLSQNADKVAWYFSDKLISGEKNASYTITEKDLPAETYEQHYSHELNQVRMVFKLVASNGGICFDSVMKEVTIIKPIARFMPDKISGCVPLQINFSDSSRSINGIKSYTYRIGSDSVTSVSRMPVAFTITKPGIFYVTETVRNGICSDISDSVRIVAGDKMVPDFMITPNEVCNGSSINLTGNTVNNSLPQLWRFMSEDLFDISFTSRPDTLIDILSDTLGYRDISLMIDYNGCLSDTTEKNIFKIKGSTGNIHETFTCDSSLLYHFKSDIAPATSLTWTVDTATFTATDSLRYQFPSSGDYIVKLLASDNSSNCSLARTRLVKVRQVIADFTLSDTILCVGDTLHLDASSSKDYINNCYNEGFLWNFGDASPPRRTFLKMYDHLYTSKGTDTVRLVVTADNGCADTVKKTVHVSRPEGKFTMDKSTGCLPSMTINFLNTSTDTTISYWIWNFGDRTSDSTNAINVSHTYTNDAPKTYYPALAVYDAYQCSSSYSYPAQLTGINNDFQANDNALCIGQSVAFTPVDSSLNIIYWDFGDGSGSASISSHTYEKEGFYTVSLVAEKNGCSDTLKRTNYIYVEKADANFTASDTILNCYPKTVSFTHNNYAGSSAVDLLWTFDNHIITDRSSSNVSYNFTKPGNFPAQLTVKTLNGCAASTSKHILINGPNAAISFSPKSICYNNSVSFRLDSMDQVSQWKWLFGDGSSSTANPVSHKYTTRGKIVPSIQLTNATCDAVMVLDTIYVSKVQAGFISSDSSQTYCSGEKTDFINRSKFSDSFEWAVNSSTVSTAYNPGNFLFSKAGDYYIRLIAKETVGCSDTLIKKFTVNPIPVFSIEGDSVICAGKNSAALKVTKETGWSIKWVPPSLVSDPASFTITVRPGEKTVFTARVTNSYGCAAARMKTVTVNEPFNLIRIPAGDTTIFLGEKIQLIILIDTGKISYSWSPDKNISCLHCNNPWVSPVKTTTFKVETKDGCFDYFESFNVEVINDFYLEAPSAFTPNGDSNNDIFRFEADNITNFDLKIFNRWGKIVFSTNDIKEGWDGNVNGHPQNIDTYKYLVRAITTHGYEFRKEGEFLLLK
jgi:gliding motility-associated-like protein